MLFTYVYVGDIYKIGASTKVIDTLTRPYYTGMRPSPPEYA